LTRPGPASIAQPLVITPSIALVTEKPGCEKSAVAFCKMTVFVASGFSNGAATTMNSWRTKFPFFERPGPLRGRFGSVRASRRKAVMPLSGVFTVMLYTDSPGLCASASNE
jgi:hypothetical protein